MSIDQPNQQFGPLDSVSMSAGEPPKPPHRYRMILITGVVVILGIIGLVVSRNSNVQQVLKNSFNYSQAPSDTTPPNGASGMVATAIVERTEPWIDIASQEGKTTYAMNETITLTLSGFSKGKDITGYDVLVAFDPALFEVVSARSVMQGFSIFEFDKGSYMTLTGIKDVGVQNPTPFDSTPLAQIVLKPKKQGTGVVSISATQGKEKTQFVDNEVNVMTPQTGGLELIIQ